MTYTEDQPRSIYVDDRLVSGGGNTHQHSSPLSRRPENRVNRLSLCCMNASSNDGWIDLWRSFGQDLGVDVGHSDQRDERKQNGDVIEEIEEMSLES